MLESHASTTLIRQHCPDFTAHRPWHQQSTIVHVAFLINAASRCVWKAAKRVSVMLDAIASYQKLMDQCRPFAHSHNAESNSIGQSTDGQYIITNRWLQPIHS